MPEAREAHKAHNQSIKYLHIYIYVSEELSLPEPQRIEISLGGAKVGPNFFSEQKKLWGFVAHLALEAWICTSLFIQFLPRTSHRPSKIEETFNLVVHIVSIFF